MGKVSERIVSEGGNTEVSGAEISEAEENGIVVSGNGRDCCSPSSPSGQGLHHVNFGVLADGRGERLRPPEKIAIDEYIDMPSKPFLIVQNIAAKPWLLRKDRIKRRRDSFAPDGIVADFDQLVQIGSEANTWHKVNSLDGGEVLHGVQTGNTVRQEKPIARDPPRRDTCNCNGNIFR